MLVGVVSLLEGEDGGVEDATVLFESVGLRGEAQDGLVAGWQPREPQLGQVVDEEVKLGSHAAQTGLDEPAGEPESITPPRPSAGGYHTDR